MNLRSFLHYDHLVTHTLTVTAPTYTHTHTLHPILLNCSVSHIRMLCCVSFQQPRGKAELFWFDMQRKHFWHNELQFGTEVLFTLIPYTDTLFSYLQTPAHVSLTYIWARIHACEVPLAFISCWCQNANEAKLEEKKWWNEKPAMMDSSFHLSVVEPFDPAISTHQSLLRAHLSILHQHNLAGFRFPVCCTIPRSSSQPRSVSVWALEPSVGVNVLSETVKVRWQGKDAHPEALPLSSLQESHCADHEH